LFRISIFGFRIFMKEFFAIKISGPAGTGIIQAGETFSKALNRLGFYTLVYPEYPSRIRGGDNNVQIVFSPEKVFAPQTKIDLLLAFDQQCFSNHEKEVKKGGLAVDFSKVDLKIEQDLAKNSAALGFLWKILGLDIGALQKQIKEDFKVNQNILELNLKAVETGYGRGEAAGLSLVGEADKNILNLTGNEALVKGILAGGCEFAAIYPMTPINSILTFLAQEKSIILFRPEDEIAGICSAIGASYAGKRAMVATSGGGFSLMVEGLGMAGIAEIPIVVILGQRTGPSTGIATYSSQADLKFAISAGQGEFPRIVLAPGDLAELYQTGTEAFNLAEVYQVPVILLADKYLAESRFSLSEKGFQKIKVSVNRGKLFNYKNYNHYNRYQITPDGISPRAFPGQTTFLTNSYEHDEKGFSVEDKETRDKMMAKRMKKLAGLAGGYEVYGKGNGTILVSWGSTKGALLGFIKKHPEYNLIHFWRVWPFPKKAEEFLKKSKKIIVVEANFSGQFADIIEQKIQRRVERVLKDDGRPFFGEEIEKLIANCK